MYRYLKYFLIFLLPAILIYSCKKDNFITDSSAKLDFSTDTVMFDTVFTTIGSTTKQFKIYNRNNQYIKVSSIYLANGSNTHFRLNINGIHASKVSNVEIPPKDSLFVFVEVTLDPNNTTNPLAIVDSVVFETNGNRQDVKLVAFGQDMFLVNGEILHNDTTWTKEKPILVYNSMLVDTLTTLTIMEGTKIFFHKNSTMYVKGNLQVVGNKDNPVIFRNDRLEHAYDDIPSQWNGIILFTNPVQNSIDFAEIRNAVIGLQVGNIENSGGAKLTLKNTIIENMSYACIFSIASEISAFNCVVANAGYYNAAIIAGGAYEFYHCTFAAYAGSGRPDPSVMLSNNVTINNVMYLGDLTKAYFGNCIIYGNGASEVGFSNDAAVQFNYKFDHCLLKIDPAENTSDPIYYNTIYKNIDPEFKSTYSKTDFQLDNLSPAKDKGDISIVNLFLTNLLNDLKGEARNTDTAPDLGAFERKEN